MLYDHKLTGVKPRRPPASLFGTFALFVLTPVSLTLTEISIHAPVNADIDAHARILFKIGY